MDEHALTRYRAHDARLLPPRPPRPREPHRRQRHVLPLRHGPGSLLHHPHLPAARTPEPPGGDVQTRSVLHGRWAPRRRRELDMYLLDALRRCHFLLPHRPPRDEGEYELCFCHHRRCDGPRFVCGLPFVAHQFLLTKIVCSAWYIIDGHRHYRGPQSNLPPPAYTAGVAVPEINSADRDHKSKLDKEDLESAD